MRRANRGWQAVSFVTAMMGAWLVAGLRPVPLVVQAQRPARSITVTGCLVDENEYASDHGLAPAGSADRSITQLVLIPDERSRSAGGAGARQPLAYALTGPNEQRLASDVHQEVSLEGVVERERVDVSPASPASSSRGQLTPDGAAGVTADGSPAHEATDATGGRRPDANAVQPDGRAASTSELDRINVASARVIGGACSIPRDRIAAAPTRALPQNDRGAQLPTPIRSEPAVTVTGCLVRREADGAAPDGLAVVTAAKDARPSAVRSAVPGSLPSGAGSETVGTSGLTAGAGTVESLTYRLTGDTSQIARFVGQRIEVTGSRDAGESQAAIRGAASAEPTTRTEAPALETAHPSAVQLTLRVTAFKSLGGACP